MQGFNKSCNGSESGSIGNNSWLGNDSNGTKRTMEGTLQNFLEDAGHLKNIQSEIDTLMGSIEDEIRDRQQNPSSTL